MQRPVYRLGSDEGFAHSFFPVDASITMSDYEENRAFTVWNDRPQAGSVHSDKSITLLVQRYVKTNDEGGLPQVMYSYNRNSPLQKTVTTYQFKAYDA